jgi:PAS domain S-box-containing protein
MKDVLSEKYNILFQHSSIAIIEEDFTPLFQHLQKSGLSDPEKLEAFFLEHPDQLYELYNLVEILEVNPAAISLFGAENRKHFLGSLKKILPPEALPFFKEEILAFLRGERKYEGETRNMRIDGSVLYLFVSVALLPEDENRCQKGIISILDIGDRRKRERDLEERKALYQTLQDITLVMAGEIHQDQLLDLVLQQLRRVVDFTCASIRFLSEGKLKAVRSLGHKERGAEDLILNQEIDPKLYPLARESLDSGEPLLIADVDQYEEWIADPALSYIKSIVFLPLKVGDRLIGQIVLEHEETGAFSLEDAERLKPFASAVAISLKNSFLYQELEKTVEQREMLLREMHHRIKNNLALVNSLINLQFQQEDDPEIASMLNHIQRKIASILLVHQKLYQGEDFKHIDLKGYLSDLLSDLVASESSTAYVNTNIIMAEDLLYSIDQVIPLGLIVSELFTNSVKYGSQESLSFSIHSDLAQDEMKITISDNGPGYPEETAIPGHLERSGGIGLVLVKALSEQIGGRCTIVPGEEGGVILELPLPESRAPMA